MILSGIAVMAVIFLIVVVTRLKPSAKVEMESVSPVSQAYPESAPDSKELPCPPQSISQSEEQGYVGNILFRDIDARSGEYSTLNSKYIRMLCTVNNAGDRTITGLQVRMVLFGFNCETLKEKLVTVIPEKRSALGPGESLNLDVVVDRTPARWEIMHVRIEPYALKLN